MGYLCNFGLSQEDERTEAAALQLGPSDRVLSIASAGDMPLSLLALGAARVDAVDVDPVQLDVMRLKLAAVMALDRADAAAFLGFLPADTGKRRAWLGEVVATMPEQERPFWDAAAGYACRGVIWSGRFERYIRRFAGPVVAIVGRGKLESLLACTSLQEQEEVFARHFNTGVYRSLFRAVFNPKVFSRRGMDPRSLQHRDARVSLGEQYFDNFRALCTGTLTRDNPWFQLMVFGHVVSAEVVPEWLTESGTRVIREHSDRLHAHQADLVAYLRTVAPGSFDKVHLSNVADWLPQDRFDEVMTLLADRMARPGRAVWRYIHVNRPVPAALGQRIRVDGDLGARLRRTDRFPFYGIVPAEIP